jgi:hypothetical protein
MGYPDWSPDDYKTPDIETPRVNASRNNTRLPQADSRAYPSEMPEMPDIPPPPPPIEPENDDTAGNGSSGFPGRSGRADDNTGNRNTPTDTEELLKEILPPPSEREAAARSDSGSH